MKINWNEESRLTWPDGSLAPYESSKMIVRKIIMLNHVDINELKKLIEIDPKLTSAYDIANLSCSGWINFDKLAQLLNAKKHEVLNGFVDQIVPINGQQFLTRYCPQCWKHKYHCSLFDLPILRQCPWHRCDLTSGCNRCVTRASLNAICKSQSPSSCSRCSREFLGFEEVMSSKQMPPDLLTQISECCDSFAAWIHVLNEKLGDSSMLLKELFDGADLDANDGKRWLLGLAIAVAGPPPEGWEFFFEPIAADLVRLEGVIDETPIYNESCNRQHLLQSDIGHCYRSLRRHIANAYVHNHKDCLKELLGLDCYEANALNGVLVCPVALAFLTWRMSIENVVLDQLKDKRDANTQLSFMGPYPAFRLSNRDLLRWSYFSFFCIWHQINERCGRNRFRIERINLNRDGHVLWKCNFPSKKQDAFQNKSRQRVGQCHAVFPSSDRLVKAAAGKCDERRRAGELMLDYQTYNNYAMFASWTGKNRKLGERRFTISKTKFFRNQGHYDYLYV
ncbi:hypothetical protein [Herminiimonas sp. KBW02]|nr:hypothetical protein [Herminiimonas sp. KBW02]